MKSSLATSALLALLLLFTSPVSALSCRDAASLEVRRVITLTQDIIVVRNDLTPGALLWRSPIYTLRFRCVDDQLQPAGEQAYLYWDPANQMAAIHPAIAVGVTFHSIDYHAAYGERLLAGVGTSPPENRANCTAYWNQSTYFACATSQEITLSVSFFIKATGAEPPQSGVLSDTRTYDVFQVDGEGGLNARPDSNYRFGISGLGRIRFVSCDLAVQITPNNTIDFGQVSANSAQAGETARTVPFGAVITRNGSECSTRPMVASFSTQNPVLDTTLILPSEDSGFGIALTQNAGSPDIPMNTVIDLPGSGSQTQVPFLAQLRWLGNKPRVGPFEASVTLDVVYR